MAATGGPNKTALKNKKKKERKKAKRAEKRAQEAAASKADGPDSGTSPATADNEAVEVKWKSEEVKLQDAELKAAFGSVFDAFAKAEVLTESKEERKARLKAEAAAAKAEAERQAAEEAAAAAAAGEEGENGDATKENGKQDGSDSDSSSDSDSDGEDGKNKLSKKQKKKLYRLKVSQLKQLVDRPDVVEIWDVTASDPSLLVYLKSYRNTVPVPKHWCQKRKYLQNKRGADKKPYELPEFIQATGIGKIREALQEKDDGKRQKQKNRERLAPKMGKIDIDYQVLHDAFFRFQTKPRLTQHGDLYYENKELEVHCDARPTVLSEELKRAVGMQAGAPPPWTFKMQMFGPPPSYPNLKIPGVNAPIPAGAEWGTQPGQWGNPPVNQFGQPMWGDIFGHNAQEAEPGTEGAPIERTKFGELEEEEAGSESESESDSDDSSADGASVAATATDAATEAGITSVATSGLTTPGVLELRKGASSAVGGPVPGEGAPAAPQQLFHVLDTSQGAGGLMGSAHTYVVPPPPAAAVPAAAASGTSKSKPKKAGVDLMKSQATEKVNITLDAEQLGNIDEATLQSKFEEGLREQQGSKLPGGSGTLLHLEKGEQGGKKRKGAGKDSKKAKKYKF
eukprot:TRINITY_DN28977_c0_g1_i1.p1 TRINITY_DN28977_c0_g1~~TRINITY_DN28977_c0_g1_i1.p1  ORF type:complete len:624 (-),score=189.11 TRINITY_DN28977_c0_g1_i1:81-1952(-)